MPLSPDSTAVAVWTWIIRLLLWGAGVWLLVVAYRYHQGANDYERMTPASVNSRRIEPADPHRLPFYVSDGTTPAKMDRKPVYVAVAAGGLLFLLSLFVWRKTVARLGDKLGEMDPIEPTH